MKKSVCAECGKEFVSLDALAQHTQAKHSEKIKRPIFQMNAKQKRKIRNWSVLIIVIVIITGGIYFLISNIKILPPTSMEGHIEMSPLSHILKEPMRIEIQKHMLEHADGSGRPGVIINYNCEDYNCEEGLIDNLETFALKYNHVYVAPFKNMDAKIALTRLGKIEILDNYNEGKIENFI